MRCVSVPDQTTAPATDGIVVVHAHRRWLARTETWLHTLVRSLPPPVEAHVVCEQTENLEEFAVPRMHVALDGGWLRYQRDRAYRRAGFRRHMPLLESVVRSLDAAVIHSHFANAGWDHAQLARKLRVRHVVSCYGFDVTRQPDSEPRWRPRLRETFRLADLVLCEAPNMADIVEALGCPRDKLRIHPLGIDLVRLPFCPRRRADDEPLRVLIAGAFREKKGIPDAIGALAEVHRRGVPVEVTVIGGARYPDEKMEEQRIRSAVAESGIAERIVFKGFQPHPVLVAEGYRHHVFLSPSVSARDGDSEGGAPVAIIEMAASGMPIVSTTHCDIPFVLGAPNRELLCPERDPVALADVIETLASADWTPIVAANRARIEENHDASRRGAALASLYREVTR